MSRKRISEIVQEKMNNAIARIIENKHLYTTREQDFSRNRQFSLDTMIRSITGFGAGTLSNELIDIGNPGTSSAFVQQRNKMKPELFKALFREFTDTLPAKERSHGYRILAVDGSDIVAPINQDSVFYRASGVTKLDGNEARGCNLIHCNAMYDVLNKLYTDFDIGKHERRSANLMTDRYNGDRAIVVFDRGYSGYNQIEHIRRNPNLEGVFRYPRTNTIREINDLPDEEADFIIEFKVSPQSEKVCKLYDYRRVDGPSPFGKQKKEVSWDFTEPYVKMKIRILRFLIPGGTWETIVTTLLDEEEFPLEEIKRIYGLRWGIETSFRELKHNLGVIYFHSKKDEFILQEIFAKIVMYNYSTAIAMHVSLGVPKTAKTHIYRIRLSDAFHACRLFFRTWCAKAPPIDDVEDVIRSHTEAVRPGRADKRKIKPQQAIPFLYRAA